MVPCGDHCYPRQKSAVGMKQIGGKKTKRTPYWSEDVKEEVHRKSEAFRIWMKERTENNRQVYVQAGDEANNIKRLAKRQTWEKLGEDLLKDCALRKLVYSVAKS